MSRHEGVQCDACEVSSFQSLRYKCLRCIDFDLCASCFNRRVKAGKHDPSHPMQCIILESDRKILFKNSNGKEMPRSYTCPLCGRPGFRIVELSLHVHAEHAEAKQGVLCPICIFSPPPTLGVSVPPGCSNKFFREFAKHLITAHHLPKDLKSPEDIKGLSPGLRALVLSAPPASPEDMVAAKGGIFYDPLVSVRTPHTVLKTSAHSQSRLSLSADEKDLLGLFSAPRPSRRQASSETLRCPFLLQKPPLSSSVATSELTMPSQKTGSNADSSTPSSTGLEAYLDPPVSSSKTSDNKSEKSADDARRETGDVSAAINANNAEDGADEEGEGSASEDDAAEASATVESSTAAEGFPPHTISSSRTFEESFAEAGKDTDPVWQKFLQELIWDSLQIPSLSLSTDPVRHHQLSRGNKPAPTAGADGAQRPASSSPQGGPSQ